MFEKFTQKALDIVINSQIYAGALGAPKVYSEHLLLGLVSSLKGVQAKLAGLQNVNFEELKSIINNKINSKGEIKNGEFIPFSSSSKEILEETMEISKFYNNSLVTPYHLALAVFSSKNSGAYEILKEFNFDEKSAISNIKGILSKNIKDKKHIHPEDEENQECYSKKVDAIFMENSLSSILSSAKSKLSTYGYEILGTEQIVQSLLDEETDITKVLEKYNITKETYSEKLKNFSDRQEEYDDRRIIFTPNAFRVVLNSFEAAKELGSVDIKPEHVILGVLRAKTGIAYKILKELAGNKSDFVEHLTKDLSTGSKTMPETLAILRLARAECKNLNQNTMGTEMILLGILAYKNGIAADVLDKLGITLKDARLQAAELIGKTNEENEGGQLHYTKRAKKLLEAAYEIAKNHGKEKIMSEHLLYAFTKIPNCLGMQLLENLGTDKLEIKQGILDELNK